MSFRQSIWVVILTLISLSASAAGAAGKWNASIEGPQGTFNMVFDFAVDNINLTGTMSNDFMGTTPISDGSINGDDLTFKIKVESPNGAMTIKYVGKVNGDEMTLTRTFETPPPGGAPAERTFTAKRVAQ